jgi:hypothetical protein
MPRVFQFVGQALFYAVAAAIIGFFATNPSYRQISTDAAQIKLSFRHGAARVEDCRKLTSEEIAKLPPKERRPNTCSRERIPIAVELSLDNQPLYAAVLEPTGLSGDGPAETYQKFLVPAGRHILTAKLRDSKREQGFDYEKQAEVDLKPLQNLAVDFKADQGGFLFR